MRKAFFAAVAVLIGVTASLALAEVVLRVADRPRPVVIGWVGGRPGETNEFGSRGHRLDPAADTRLVLLGDSQVEAAATAFEEMPEVQLGRAVAGHSGRRVSVVSIAAGGWGQDQQLLALSTHIARIRPTAVVLWFTASNDLWNNTFPTHFPEDGWPKPTFWLEGGELKGPNLAWLSSYRPPGLYLLQAVRRAVGKPRYPTDREWERRLPPAYQAVVAPAAARSLAQTLADQRGIRVDELPYFHGENFESEKTHYSIHLVPPSRRLQYSATLTRALLLRIRDVCAAHGAKFVILDTEKWKDAMIPENPTMFEVRGKGFMLSSASARRLVEGVLDGLPTIRVAELPAGAVVSKTDHHLNAKGHRQVMESLARHLVRQL